MAKATSVLNVLGALASSVALAFCLGDASTGTKVWLGIVIAVSLVAIGVLWYKSIPHRPRRVKRDQMVEREKAVLNDVIESAVFFGSDLSWLSDYSGSISKLLNEGKQVAVFADSRKGSDVRNQNIDTLRRMGVEVIDSRVVPLRGLLVDPQSADCTYVHTQRRRSPDNSKGAPYEFMILSYPKHRVHLDSIRGVLAVLVDEKR